MNADESNEDQLRRLLKERDKDDLVDLVIRLSLEVSSFQSRLEALEGRAGIDSENSHRPPSQDPPSSGASGNRKARRRKSSKKRGGQPGRKGTKRVLVPVEEVDQVVPVRPGSCKACSGSLSPSDRPPSRHQVWELPAEIRCQLTEYQLHALYCPDCDLETRASLPLGVSESAFGPRAHAMVGYLSGGLRMSDRQVQEVLGQVFHLDLSVGTVANLRRTVSGALEAPYEEVREEIRSQPVVHADETFWRESGERSWLWTAVTNQLTVFMVQLRRNRECAEALLGPGFEGTLVADRMGAYNYVSDRQACWAHLLRDFRRIQDRGGLAGQVGARMVAIAEAVLADHRKAREGRLQWDTLRRKSSELRRELRAQLELGAICGHARTMGTCRNMLRWEDAFWRYRLDPDIAPTNNAAERALRPGVIWRKVRLGTQSVAGSIFVERILTALTTLKQQGRNALAYLEAAVSDHFLGLNAPTLLPA